MGCTSAKSNQILDARLSPASNKEEVLLLFCRHGERCDNSEIPQERARIENVADPPLSNLGVSQAHVTGEYLRTYLAENGIENIIIESSPLLRTLETAAAIAHELKVAQIRINYRAFEWMSSRIFPDNCPVDDIQFLNCSSLEEEKRFCKDKLGYPELQIDHPENRDDSTDQLRSSYPEDRDAVNGRFNSLVGDLRKKYTMDAPSVKTAHLIVSHGISVNCFTKFVAKSSPTDREHVKPKSFVNYCALGAAQIHGEKFRLVLGGAIPYLKNDAAQLHLNERLMGVPEKAFALQSVKPQ